MSWSVLQSDCIDFLASLPESGVDLVFGSPPYMDARTYGIDADRQCQEWVAWMLRVTAAAVRASRGLVLWVAAGVQRENCYWPGCEGLLWEWWKRGGHCWQLPIWWKVDNTEGGNGILGSGGRQWLRNDWVCTGLQEAWSFAVCRSAGNGPSADRRQTWRSDEQPTDQRPALQRAAHDGRDRRA
jgi:hypothetical protein